MRIGEISHLTGLSVPSIRRYEKLGLIKASRGSQNYRSFSEKDVQTLLFVARCRDNNMKLSCIRTLLQARQDKSNSPADLCERIDTFIAGAKEQIEHMQQVIVYLQELKDDLTKSG